MLAEHHRDFTVNVTRFKSPFGDRDTVVFVEMNSLFIKDVRTEVASVRVGNVVFLFSGHEFRKFRHSLGFQDFDGISTHLVNEAGRSEEFTARDRQFLHFKEGVAHLFDLCSQVLLITFNIACNLDFLGLLRDGDRRTTAIRKR